METRARFGLAWTALDATQDSALPAEEHLEAGATDCRLCGRQAEVMIGLMTRTTREKVAADVGISPHTLETHRRRAVSKPNTCVSTTQLILRIAVAATRSEMSLSLTRAPKPPKLSRGTGADQECAARRTGRKKRR